MAFTIDPSALDTHAGTLTSLSEKVAQADTYVNDHMSLTVVDSTGLFAMVLGHCNNARDALLTLHSELEEALRLSGEELAATAQRSRELDDAIEAELDAAYPYPVESGDAQSPSTDSACIVPPDSPESHLTAPATEAPTDLVSEILTTDWLSPSGLISDIIGRIFNWNPVDEVSKKLSGNWASLYAVESALKNLGDFHRSQGSNITYAMSVTASSWDGEAADAANVFFTAMGTTSRDAGDQATELAPEFGIVAAGMESTGSLVGGFFTGIMDALIVAAIAYAAGGATAFTGVGAIVGGVGGTVALGRAAYLAKEAYDALQTTLDIIDALGAAIGVFESFAVDGADYPNPVPYDNPAV
jgi:hypothetical protein